MPRRRKMQHAVSVDKLLAIAKGSAGIDVYRKVGYFKITGKVVGPRVLVRTQKSVTDFRVIGLIPPAGTKLEPMPDRGQPGSWSYLSTEGEPAFLDTFVKVLTCLVPRGRS